MIRCDVCRFKEYGTNDYPRSECDATNNMFKPKAITNADKIRAMNDEELAGLTITYNDYYGEYYCRDGERYDSYEDAIKHEIKWLQSEAE